MKMSFAPLVKTSAPAVVNVYAAKTLPQQRSPFMGDPFFEQFFGRQMQRQSPRVQSSLGSGVIVDPSGLIVTNNHVVADADEVRVALADGREFDAKILSKDERIDLAVLKIEDEKAFPVLGIADSDRLEIGDLVLAIGNPFGIGQTVTNGIVSALARTHIGTNDFGFFIQTDAAINPGNSGGALIDTHGQLIGVNTAIFSRSGGSNGIGFAIPSNMVRAFVDSARKGGRFERPFIGATFVPVTRDVAEALGLDRPRGALVQDVREGAPAASAGLKPGDVVLAMDNFEIGDPDTLGYRLATAGIGKDATLSVLSGNKRETLRMSLAGAPEMPAADRRTLKGETPFAGASIANLSPKLADELDIPEEMSGVVVTDVRPGSFAARFGLQPKDIVLTLNGDDVESSAALEKMAANAKRGWRFEIERDGRRLSQVVR
ncbi:DegQ family serine endoprotease [Aureimonas psammosilenae]|uniref:DegQ family serine endoprotease n=1 Tax=Aureimonas psammosilenae TaxID=2495496 RepID=UPI001F1AE421|nr:DegQ family serine endoprotease [Aureimonas psammosilenae]